jgi:hypothetical protein
VCAELEVFADTLVCRCINHGDCGSFIIAIYLPRRTEIVSVTSKVNAGNHIERGSVIYVKLSLCTRHKQLVGFRGIDHTLRSRYVFNAVYNFLCAQAYYFFAVVAESRNE